MSEVSDSVGRYLSTIHLLTATSERRAKTGELADALDVSAASVTEMLTTLEERDLATYEKYEGVELTEDGEATARELMWRHCVAENFLADDLGVNLEAIADGEGDPRAIGNALSAEAVGQLKTLIDHPCDGECSAPQREYNACRDDVRGEDRVSGS